MSGIGGLAWLDGRKDFDDAALLQRFTSALRPYGTTRQETLVSRRVRTGVCPLRGQQHS
jgi:hypothetical protein